MYINPHSKHIAADLTFIKWLSSTSAQTILAVKYSEIPTVESVRTSPSVVSLNPVLAIVGKTKLVPRQAGTPNYPALSTAIYTNVNAILAGSTSPSAGALGRPVPRHPRPSPPPPAGSDPSAACPAPGRSGVPVPGAPRDSGGATGPAEGDKE